MQLPELLREIEVLQLVGPPGPDVREPHFDSRKVQAGDLFVAVPGTQVDGHDFIDRVIGQGAKVIVCERLPDELAADVTYVRVARASLALGMIANAFHRRPSEKMVLVGVTGTNGKTTTATLLYRLFSALGRRTGLLSTIRNYAGDDVVPSTHTTGDALQISSLMARMVAAGCTHCFMEVTSHAIHQDRIAGLQFDGAIFTNLTHDHLDYHGTLEAYRDVKKSWFDELPPTAFALTNLDDPVGALMTRDTAARRFSYGAISPTDFPLIIARSSADGLELTLGGRHVSSRLVGAFNAYNLAAAFGAAVLMGVDDATVAATLSTLAPVEGRMERIDGPRGITAVIDFAHTPDALQKALATLRASALGAPLICVVGCGGDRDREKRPEMAGIAARGADRVIFTTDNPRSEDPDAILREMMAGVQANLVRRVSIIQDRKNAIRTACADAPPGTVILIAGKGHEKYQDIAGERHPFDDVECARAALNG
jgi:UDP-N-acetylmuramoyl-L-alanyl-D-glutamate--2,6-diaminopimelate ligase